MAVKITAKFSAILLFSVLIVLILIIIPGCDQQGCEGCECDQMDCGGKGEDDAESSAADAAAPTTTNTPAPPAAPSPSADQTQSSSGPTPPAPDNPAADNQPDTGNSAQDSDDAEPQPDASAFSPTPTLSNLYKGQDINFFYLLNSKQASKTPKIMEIADSITSTQGMDMLSDIVSWLHSNLADCGSKDKLRALTADQIIDAGCAQGCTDYALVFVAIARAKGIPASYVDTIQENYLNQITADGRISGIFYGHAFSDVYIDGSWITVDPTAGNALNPGNYINGPGGTDRYVVFGRGLDNTDFGYETDAEFKEKVASFYNIAYN